MTRAEEGKSAAGYMEPVQVASFSIADDALPFLADMQAALAQPVKSISPKHFYDARGSALFDHICDLPEYYPTRTEVSILQSHAGDIAQRIGPHAEIIEFGAGSLRKVRILLAALDAPERYVPIDISGEHLRSAADTLHAEFAGLDISPLVADYTQDWMLPAMSRSAHRRVAFFPGSSIGNFTPAEARQFLARCARALGAGALLLGVDLIKHPDILHYAYNDAQGVTAAFNLNLLERANRELGANFKLLQFAHSAFYNAPQQRIEMHLISTCQQTVRVGDAVFGFEEGETLHTENSHKYTIDSMHRMARDCGLAPGPVWADPLRAFGLLWLDIPE
jgi:dimethylhistidine N-methyltransferase